MAKLFISDIHIGDKHSGVFDIFPFLKKQDDIDEVILLGDIFDFWVTSLANEKHAETLAWLFITLQEYKLTWVAGNHDAEIWPFSEFCRIKDYYIGQDYMAVHGHKFDPSDYEMLKGNNYALAKMINWINGRFKYDMRIWLSSVSKKTVGVRMKRVMEIYQRAAAEYGGFKYVIIGHTHNPCIMEMDSGLHIMDCGDWREHRTAIKELDDRFQLLDFETGEIVVKQELIK